MTVVVDEMRYGVRRPGEAGEEGEREREEAERSRHDLDLAAIRRAEEQLARRRARLFAW
jgi:hypothetical protein